MLPPVIRLSSFPGKAPFFHVPPLALQKMMKFDEDLWFLGSWLKKELNYDSSTATAWKKIHCGNDWYVPRREVKEFASRLFEAYGGEQVPLNIHGSFFSVTTSLMLKECKSSTPYWIRDSEKEELAVPRKRHLDVPGEGTVWNVDPVPSPCLFFPYFPTNIAGETFDLPDTFLLRDGARKFRVFAPQWISLSEAKRIFGQGMEAKKNRSVSIGKIFEPLHHLSSFNDKERMKEYCKYVPVDPFGEPLDENSQKKLTALRCSHLGWKSNIWFSLKEANFFCDGVTPSATANGNDRPIKLFNIEETRNTEKYHQAMMKGKFLSIFGEELLSHIKKEIILSSRDYSSPYWMTVSEAESFGSQIFQSELDAGVETRDGVYYNAAQTIDCELFQGDKCHLITAWDHIGPLSSMHRKIITAFCVRRERKFTSKYWLTERNIKMLNNKILRHELGEGCEIEGEAYFNVEQTTRQNNIKNFLQQNIGILPYNPSHNLFPLEVTRKILVQAKDRSCHRMWFTFADACAASKMDPEKFPKYVHNEVRIFDGPEGKPLRLINKNFLPR